MKLSILICTLKTRRHFLKRLLEVLTPQLTPEVEIITEEDNGEVPIGRKRNRLLNKANGLYCCFVDDDDLVSDNYVAAILEAIQTMPDVVGFKVDRLMDGQYEGEGIHSLRFKQYRDYVDAEGERIFERTPNHLNPVRLTLAKQTGFNNSNFGEDSDYAARLLPLLQKEVFIDDYLYSYLYRRPNNRTGEVINEAAVKEETEEMNFANEDFFLKMTEEERRKFLAFVEGK